MPRVPDYIMWEEFTQDHADNCRQVVRWFENSKTLTIKGVPIYVKNSFPNDVPLLAFFELLADHEANIWNLEIEALKNDPQFGDRSLTHFRVMNRLEYWRLCGSYLLEDTHTDTP